MKAKLVNVDLAIWGIRDFKHNVVPLYMAQMAYVEVALNIDMDWSTILMSLQTHMKPKILQRTLWLIEITTRNFVFCNLSYATKKSHMQLFWSYMQHV